MDPAVGLVQAYLRMNGFFTVTEYPVVTETRQGSRVLTDLDLLALRFPGAGRWIQGSNLDWRTFRLDPSLPDSDQHLVMILGEVKEEKTVFNRNAFHPDVLEAALRRYACCQNVREAALTLSRKGCLTAPLMVGSPCEIHTMLFGGTDAPKRTQTHYVSLRHAAEFLARTIRSHPEVFIAAQPKDTVLDLISIFVKTGASLTAFKEPRNHQQGTAPQRGRTQQGARG